jgi:hypothetical protein
VFYTWGLTWHLNSRTYFIDVDQFLWNLVWVEAQVRLSAQGQKDTGVPNTHVLDVHMEPPTDTNKIRARLMLKIPPNFSTEKKNDFKPGLRGRVCPGCFLQDRAHGWLHSQNGQLDDQEQFFSGRHTLLTTVTRKYRACQLIACL